MIPKTWRKMIIRHKNIILLILGIIIIIYLIPSIKEGFTMTEACADTLTEYAYLKPISQNNKLSESTMNNLVKFRNTQTGCPDGVAINPEKGDFCNTVESVSGIEPIISDDEVEYYIANGKWPYGSYIKNYLPTACDEMNKKATGDLQPVNPDYIQSVYPTTLAYIFFMAGDEINNIQQNGAAPSVAYQIIMGTIPPTDPVVSGSMSGIECSVGTALGGFLK